jgi:hypothetical protein
VRRLHPFVWGYMVAAFVAGVVSGAVLDWKAVVIFSCLMAAGAAIASLVCWWRPGFEAAGWKLWLVATVANPLLLAGIGLTIDQYDCLFQRTRGWSCMFADLSWMLVAVCLPSPLIGLAVRRWKRSGLQAIK